MNLKKNLEKIMDELEKLEEKKKDFLEEYDQKRRKLLGRKKELETRIKEKNDEEILASITSMFGKLDEDSLPSFLNALKKNKDDITLEMEISEEEMKEKVFVQDGGSQS